MKVEDMLNKVVKVDGLEDVVGYLREIEALDDSHLVLAILQEVSDRGLEEEIIAIPCDLSEILVQTIH